MENSVNNCTRQRVFSNHQIRTIHEEDQEESSWIVYFEDIDHDDEMVETEQDMSHYYDNDSSMISDAASPVRTNNVVRRKATNINTNPKKRRIIHQHKDEEEEHKGEIEEEDEEDTASSPSNKTKVRYILDGAEDTEKAMDNVTSEEKGYITLTETGSKINEVMNEEFSAELKKRGLCVVPLSMLSNFIA
ncbi:hypothetical protein CARUB_v10012201mg [Capsella rubella]|uniref:Uncharacterized protein n=1 Tax=Capsella rubella TaxID=81985 RepID=R0I9X2_9BRAS|nr:vascular-related unknown protein 2 [Capsella rubella]EOA39224.1 hypothetical protein CARUB_v10012201mg [Capsella rubella]